MQLKTHQTGPEGQKVRRLLIEEGADIKKEYYVAALTDRATQKVALMAQQRRRHGHRGSGARHAGEDPQGLRRPAGRPDRRAGRASSPPASACPRPAQAQAVDVLQEALRLLHGHRRLAGRDQPADPRGRQAGNDQGARREVQLRLATRCSATPRSSPTATSTKKTRPRSKPASSTSPTSARRQHRLPGQRRRPGDGDDGHDQAVRRRAGQLPRRRRRRHRREGHRGLQDHARATRR